MGTHSQAVLIGAAALLAGSAGAAERIVLDQFTDAVISYRYVDRFTCGYFDKEKRKIVRTRPPVVTFLSGNPRTGGDVRITCPTVFRK